jgi:hypothetical protein
MAFLFFIDDNLQRAGYAHAFRIREIILSSGGITFKQDRTTQSAEPYSMRIRSRSHNLPENRLARA